MYETSCLSPINNSDGNGGLYLPNLLSLNEIDPRINAINALILLFAQVLMANKFPMRRRSNYTFPTPNRQRSTRVTRILRYISSSSVMSGRILGHSDILSPTVRILGYLFFS